MPSIATQDKTLSRMRAHKGNVPSLPQTKCCTLCPAKFTRTTHLNRHLRSHTNERLHRCDICKTAEFTRSDLLTRHKRTCGQSVNRSRRKSCEACAESKIKCNLQYPCAKCTSRGRECVFLNDPEETRSKCLSSKTGSRKSTAPSTPATISRSPTPSLSSESLSPSPPPESLDSTTNGSPSSMLLDLPPFPEPGASSEPSIRLSPRSETGHTFEENKLLFDFPFDVGGFDDPLVSMLSPFDHNLFSCGFLSLEASKAGSDAALNGVSSDAVPPVDDDNTDLFSSLVPMPSADTPPPAPALGNMCTTLLMSQPTLTLDCLDARDVESLSFGASSIDSRDTYLHLFFTRFLSQVPLIHAPTWKMSDTPLTLARIFRACGALFVKTDDAADFVTATLASATTEISEEFNKVNDTNPIDAGTNTRPTECRHRINLILSLVLLQTICLFQREGRLGLPNVQHHAMLVAMIRQTGLIDRVASWKAPEWSDPVSLETAWTEWVQFATVKRALLLAYFHDCCHCMYAAAPPAFTPAEFDVPLPCDDALWHAESAAKWAAAAHTPSPYGIGKPRIYGVNMQQALSTLSTPGRDMGTLARTLLPPFALFLLIHTVLRNISLARCAPPAPPGGWSCFAVVSTASQTPTEGGGAEWTFRTQAVLDNWLHLWMTNPDAALPGQETVDAGAGTEKAVREPPFVYNSLPFYWLAQVSLWESSGSGPALVDMSAPMPMEI